jgi:hypothetical protein
VWTNAAYHSAKWAREHKNGDRTGNRPSCAHERAPLCAFDAQLARRADTLVIDTIGQKVGPLSMADRFGTPFSTGLHVIERYRLMRDGARSPAKARKLFFRCRWIEPHYW